MLLELIYFRFQLFHNHFPRYMQDKRGNCIFNAYEGQVLTLM